jgi:hypothetical protein
MQIPASRRLGCVNALPSGFSELSHPRRFYSSFWPFFGPHHCRLTEKGHLQSFSFGLTKASFISSKYHFLHIPDLKDRLVTQLTMGQWSACNRCRRRKQKCDNARPQCKRCTKSNIPCGYPLSHKIQQPNRASGKNRTFAPARMPPSKRDATVQEIPSKPRTTPYTEKQVCFLVNWLDYCIMNNKSFQATIVQEFNSRFGREVSSSGSERKAIDKLREIAYPTSFELRNLRTKGSKSFSWDHVPLDLVNFYNSGRQELGLPLLSVSIPGGRETPSETNDTRRSTPTQTIPPSYPRISISTNLTLYTLPPASVTKRHPRFERTSPLGRLNPHLHIKILEAVLPRTMNTPPKSEGATMRAEVAYQFHT